MTWAEEHTDPDMNKRSNIDFVGIGAVSCSALDIAILTI